MSADTSSRRVRHRADGTAEVVQVVTGAMLNALGVCHEGFVFALGEAACDLVPQAGETASPGHVSSVVFLNQAREGDTLVAIARLAATGGSPAVICEATVFVDPEPTPIARITRVQIDV